MTAKNPSTQTLLGKSKATYINVPSTYHNLNDLDIDQKNIE